MRALVSDHIVVDNEWKVLGHTSTIPPFNFLVTDDPNEAEIHLRGLVETNEYLGMDTEANSLEWEMPTTEMHGFSVAGKDNALYIYGRASVDTKILEYLEWIINNKKTIWYNIHFDLHILAKYGVHYTGWKENLAQDIYIMSRLNNRSDSFSDGGLKGTAFTYLDHENLPTFSKLLSQYENSINNIPIEILGRYSAFDARITYDLYHPLYTILNNEKVLGKKDTTLHDYYLNVHLRASEGTFRMEKNGMYVNVPFLNKINKEATEIIESTGNFWARATGCNMNSSAQKTYFFFNVMGHKSKKKTNTGKASITSSVLKDLAIDGDIWASVYAKIIAPATKIKSTYTEPILDRVHRLGKPIIHGSFSIPKARTGRTACVPINSQALTKDGWKFYDDIKIGDVIMGFDIHKENYVWTVVKDIHVGDEFVGLIKTNRERSTEYNKGVYCTGNHRWVIKHKQSNIIGFGCAENKNQYYYTLLANNSLFPEPKTSILSPEQAFIFGWYLTDGRKMETSSGRVAMETHLVKNRSISLIEKSVSGYNKSEYKNKTRFYFGADIFDTIYNTAIHYSPSELIINLSVDARKAMLSAMLEADGSKRKGNERYDRFACERGDKKKVNEYFEILATSLGVIWTVINKVLPSGKNFMFYNLHKSTEKYKQDSKWKPEYKTKVWCPETSCGTWIMKQGDEIVITGNSSNPNLQNIPAKGKWGKLMRQAFTAPLDYMFLRADYSQLELRVLAHFTRDKAWLDMFMENGDPHELTAETVGVTRDQAKVVNFGIIYGMSPKALAGNMKDWGAGNISVQQAEEIISIFYSNFPETLAWMEKVKEYARRLGYVQTILGRKRWLPDITSRNTYDRGRAERQAVNTIIQGSAADIMNIGVINVTKEIDKYNIYAEEHSMKFMLLADVVHDEVGCYVPVNKYMHSMAKRVGKALESAGEYCKLIVPLVAEPELGNNWAEVKK